MFLCNLNTITIKPKQQIKATINNTASTATPVTLPVQLLSLDSAEQK